MQDLRVIGVENGALLVASDEGVRYRIAIDEVLQSRLRQPASDSDRGARVAPREIQNHIRGGMTAEQVASLTGASIEYVQKFEGPVIAEREFIVETALKVPVHTAGESDPSTSHATFGSVMRERLRAVDASDERWASWKETEAAWVLKLTFTSAGIDHDARWSFDPKKMLLAPANAEANRLSQLSDAAPELIPRLRAVGPDTAQPDATRFDSAVFEFGVPEAPPAEALESFEAADPPSDLLETLRRRRGEREAATFEPPTDGLDEVEAAAQSRHRGIRLVDVPIAVEAAEIVQESNPQTSPITRSARRGRPAMPSWDEIVFGARSDDDPA